MLHKISCIIIEDELPASRLLEMHIAKFPFLVLKGSYVSPLNAMSVLRTEKIDLVFLDINLPGKTGIEFAKTLPSDVAVIFTTAYTEYAVDGFELEAIDYLLKPVSLARFSKAINKFNKIRQLMPIAEPTELSITEKPFVFVKCERKLMKLFLDDILYFESQGNCLLIYTTGKGCFKTYQTITEMEEKLPENVFCRIHRSFLVSVPKVTAFNSHTITIEGKQLSIGRFYSGEVNKLLRSISLNG
ncbi:LytR/AlgR family response regulator transcription factor [Solitalea canadensis]|uniref:Response regulator of the LytR/AlgR family n=1 Tax=Solitalea canadensis (strain ATCC 29591 / DSM 3403 / JCM 21819 / LMG 8368 / NBRC 15130 / NCIMB 12057 / USAM 9D) TaxID=929556 RepID=H8KT96_SOLCM|nr:LytTR family DNA-binding domain-containing protein [Solitalea canadensis]AFD05279.1 response regulator of the LytR/AlgR family [Solitalea canadensis DSM 3403]